MPELQHAPDLSVEPVPRVLLLSTAHTLRASRSAAQGHTGSSTPLRQRELYQDRPLCDALRRVSQV
ncbi:MAG TPA: hypothetical protein PKH77_24985 [Anaerolineae bacterium]|nr:hypothetical protein [Anaerolineae bacterium]